MKQSKLAQKRHRHNLKRKQKKFNNKKHNKNLLEYCKHLLPPEEKTIEI